MEKKVVKEEIRCQACNKKLGVGVFQILEIKCPRCKTLNSIKLER